jgi:hypothetical protein
MTAYLSQATTAASKTFVIKANSYDLKVSQVNLHQNSNSGGPNFLGECTIYRTTAASISGGSNAATITMRQGSLASTVTAKYQATVSGTKEGFAVITASLGSTNTWEPPVEMIISPGSALSLDLDMTGSGITGEVFVSVSFEELRLSWHY